MSLLVLAVFFCAYMLVSFGFIFFSPYGRAVAVGVVGGSCGAGERFTTAKETSSMQPSVI